MKKSKAVLPLLAVWFVIAILLLFAIKPEAQSTASYGFLVSSLSTTSTGVVAGTSFALPQGNASIITWTVTADGSAISTTLDGSMDNSVWFVLDTITTPATGAIKNYGFTSIKFFRISQVSRTGGTTTSGTVLTSRGFITSTGSSSMSSSTFLAGDGTQALPSFAFASQPNTGIFHAGANDISISSNGSRNFAFSGDDFYMLGGTTPMIFFSTILFANLGTPANGAISFCSDCTIASPCAGAGTGAFAKRLNGIWVCN